MYKNIAMLVFLLLTAVTVTFVNKAKADGMSSDKAQPVKPEPAP
jgi:hypothetical protein